VTDTIPDGYPTITLEEITKKTSQGSVRREFKPGMSPIVPKHHTYYEYENLGDSARSINIKYYEAINSYFAEIIFNGITEKLEKGMKWRGMTIFTKNIITDDEMKNLWGVDNLALTDEEGEIIIQKGNTVLHLNDYSGNMDLNDRQTRELIIDRFFPGS
jgi:predicted transcriptional regulator